MLISRERASYKVSGQTRRHMCQCNSDDDDGSNASKNGMVDCHVNRARDTENSPATSQDEASVAGLLYPLDMIYSCFPTLLESMGQLYWHLYSKMRRSFQDRATWPLMQFDVQQFPRAVLQHRSCDSCGGSIVVAVVTVDFQRRVV